MESRIIEKLKKLQALAGNNPSEQEAALAAAKLQSLLLEYNLSMADVDAFNTPEKKEKYEKNEALLEANKFTLRWKVTLYSGIADLNFCKLIMHPGTRRISLIGKPSNVESVMYMAGVLVRQIERLADEASTVILNKRAMYHREFCFGAALRILGRLRAERDAAIAASQTTTALVKTTGKELETATKQFFPRLRTDHWRGSTGSTGGFSDGSKAGASMGLPRGGIESGSGRHQLT